MLLCIQWKEICKAKIISLSPSFIKFLDRLILCTTVKMPYIAVSLLHIDPGVQAVLDICSPSNHKPVAISSTLKLPFLAQALNSELFLLQRHIAKSGGAIWLPRLICCSTSDPGANLLAHKCLKNGCILHKGMTQWREKMVS